jgi:ankyrin repeat protein
MARNSFAAFVLIAAIGTAWAGDAYGPVEDYMVKGSYGKAARLLDEMARRGDTEAMYRLANLYRAGVGIPQNLPESLHLYERAAQLGHVPAQYMTGQCYERGIGTAKDIAKAGDWYARAAKAGDTRAQQRLGNLADQPAELLAVMALTNEDAVLAQLHDRDLTVTDEHGQTLLMAAAAAGHARVIDQLIAAHLTVDQRDRGSRTALFYAAEQGHDAALEALLAAGADPNLADRNGDTPLHVAIARRHASSVNLLTRHGADLAARNAAGWSAAQLAQAKGVAADPSKASPTEALDGRARLAGLRKDKRFDGWPDLNVAAWNGNADLVRMLLPQADVNAVDGSGRTALMRAVDQGYEAIVAILLDAGARTDILPPGNQSVVALAIERGFDPIAVALLDAGAPSGTVDSQGRYPLGLAAARPDSAMVDRLLAHAADANQRAADGKTALMIAAASGATPSVQTLLAHGADATLVDAQGRSTLWYTAGGCDAQQMTLVLGALGNVDKRKRFVADAAGVTPLHRAVGSHADKCVNALLQAGHDPNVASESGSTPLHVAALSGDLVPATLLTAAGAKLDSRDSQGNTPLFVATKAHKYDMAKFLLQQRANPRIRNTNAVSAYDLARNDPDARWLAMFDEQAGSVLSLLGANR